AKEIGHRLRGRFWSAAIHRRFVAAKSGDSSPHSKKSAQFSLRPRLDYSTARSGQAATPFFRRRNCSISVVHLSAPGPTGGQQRRRSSVDEAASFVGVATKLATSSRRAHTGVTS